jgi:hypothetical protein
MKKNLILFCLIPVIFIQLPLYGKIPTPWESRNPPKETTENNKQETEPYQCSTKNLSALKILVNASQTNEEPSNECDEGNDTSSHNWWASSNWVLAFLTFVLVLVMIIQVVAMFKQSHWLKEQSGEIRESIGVAYKGLILAQRPRLRIRNVEITNLFNDTDNSFQGKFYIVNIGGTPARITNIGCWVEFLNEGLPMQRPYEGKNPTHQEITVRLRPGQSFIFTFHDDWKRDLWNLQLKRPTACILYVMGYIEYADDIEILRRTTFCREYRYPEIFVAEQQEVILGIKRKGRFFPVEDPDYENEE